MRLNSFKKELHRMQTRMSYNPGTLYGMEPVMDHTPTKEILVSSP